METVELHLFSKSPHISMVVVGFLMLENQGLVKVRIVPRYDSIKKYPHPHIVEAIINNKIFVYDCWDLCDWTASDWEKDKWKNICVMESLMDNIDFYFKRSYFEGKNLCLSEKNKKKIYPLGLFFRVSIKGNPIDFLDYSTISYNHIKKTIKYYLFQKMHNKYYTIDRFESSANFTNAKDLKIIFLTRLWNPLDKDVWDKDKKTEREYINDSRIEIIKKLKQSYPDNFVGGIEDSGFARQICKELIVQKKITRRSNYLELMKKCDICIGTMGLHGSIGGKTAEYVVAARAIVNEKFKYEIPCSFEPYKNYLPFETPDECVKAVSTLMKNPEQVYLQKKENEKYYKSFLRPDKQILYTINVVKNQKLF